MADEVTSTAAETVTQTSDGFVRITIEKYEELVDKIADQKGTISGLRESLNSARLEPPVIHRTVVNKTDEMLSQEHRVWGGTLMGLGASFFIVGALRYRRA